MDSETDSTISSLTNQCFAHFISLSKLLPAGEENRSRLDDDLGRFRVWVGNFGAHRKPSDTLSLDHRVREASSLRHEVQNHIHDISEALKGGMWYSRLQLSYTHSFLAIRLLPEESKYSAEKIFYFTDFKPNDSESEDSDGDNFWEQIKAESNEHSRLDEYLKDIQFTVTSL